MYPARILALLACALPSAGANYSTYIGDAYPYTVSAITVDSSGNTYVTGSRLISLSPVSPTSPDIFVSKLDTSGNVSLLTAFGGKGSDYAYAIAVDAAGNIYIAGGTSSPDFPLRQALQTTPASSGTTGFLVKLDPSGAMLYSTYLGGTTGWSALDSVAVDSVGNAYVTGYTFATDYPSTAGLPAIGTSDSLAGAGAESAAFFAKISPAGDKLLYAGGLGASGRACGTGSRCYTSTVTNNGAAIAVDAGGNAYIGGNTYGGGLATTPGALEPQGIGGFVAKVNASGTGMAYVTLLGTANYYPPPDSISSVPATFVHAIAVDSSGDAYVVGSTSDPNFPATASAFQKQLAFTGQAGPYNVPPSDAFIAKLNPSGTAMVWATFLGGTGADVATRLALDSAGNVWAAGSTGSTDFPQASGFPNGTEFLAELNAGGTALLDSQLFPAGTVASGIAVDAGGTIHLAGAAGLVSANAPPVAGPQIFGIANAAGGTLAGRVTAGEVISIYGAGLGPTSGVSGSFDSAGYLPVSLGGVHVTIAGMPAPLLYVSNTQINAVAPEELTGTAPSLEVAVGNSALPPFRLVIDPAIPEVFRLAAGNAAAINQDGTVNSQSNPAKNGTIVSVWATGTGVSYGAIDGKETTAAGQLCSCEVYSAGIQSTSPQSASGQPVGTSLQYAQVFYAGAAPGMVTGVVQVNFQVTGSSNYYVLTSNLKTSDLFFVYVTQ